MAEFKGPLGIWGFPIINLILKTFGERGASVKPIQPIHNIEEWEWTDSAGNVRKLTVHRKVE